MYYPAGNNWKWVDTGIDINDNKYHHLVTSYNKVTGDFFLYLDGTLVAKYNNPTPVNFGNLSDAITIGYR